MIRIIGYRGLKKSLKEGWNKGDSYYIKSMRYRDQINLKLDVLENNLRMLEQIVQRQLPVKEYLDTLERTKSVLDDVKSLVSIEPVTNNEISN